jgi:dynactin-4
MPSGEARVKKNRCGTCFECPLCSMTLAVRATSALPPGATRAAGESSAASSSEVSTTGGATPTKAYYLLCNSCRWSTRDAAIADQSSATAGWPVHVDHNEKNVRNPRFLSTPIEFMYVVVLFQFNDVLEQFKSLASVEKTERERKKYTKRRSNMGNMFSDKYGLQAIYNRRRLGIGMTEK